MLSHRGHVVERHVGLATRHFFLKRHLPLHTLGDHNFDCLEVFYHRLLLVGNVGGGEVKVVISSKKDIDLVFGMFKGTNLFSVTIGAFFTHEFFVIVVVVLAFLSAVGVLTLETHFTALLVMNNFFLFIPVFAGNRLQLGVVGSLEILPVVSVHAFETVVFNARKGTKLGFELKK